MEKTYYYCFKKADWWLVFNILITFMILMCLKCGAWIWFLPQMQVLVLLSLFAWGLWCYKYIHPQKMAVVTDDFIQIDHCRPLYWKDVDYAEEREVYCCFKKLKIIALVPKKGIDYRYNWLQKHNSDFTAFSIPLYGILKAEDEEELKALVAAKTKLKACK